MQNTAISRRNRLVLVGFMIDLLKSSPQTVLFPVAARGGAVDFRSIR